MKSFLKSEPFPLPDGDTLTIRELSAGGRRALVEATREKKADPFMVAAIAARAGVVEFADHTAEQVLDLLPMDLLNEIATAVFKLSGLSVESEAQAEKN